MIEFIDEKNGNNLVNKHKLAIVVPFFKIKHFEELLLSLVNQTNQNFSLYIGDDKSPNDPVKILKKYHEKLSIVYKRFDERMGNANLTRQWDRCVDLVQDEEWVWVLPDDDLPSPDCVKEFYLAIEKYKEYNVKVFRIPLEIIDNNGSILKVVEDTAPEIESNYEFYSRIVRGKAGCSLGDNIFHRKSLQETGGFIDFPKAWGSDHATVLRVSEGGSLCFLKNAKFGFRMSGENISSDTSDGMEKISARIMFAKWMKDNESIFDGAPDAEFYKKFYIKGESFFVYSWPFSFKLWGKLYEFSVISHESYTPIPLLKLFLIKILVKLRLRS